MVKHSLGSSSRPTFHAASHAAVRRGDRSFLARVAIVLFVLMGTGFFAMQTLGANAAVNHGSDSTDGHLTANAALCATSTLQACLARPAPAPRPAGRGVDPPTGKPGERHVPIQSVYGLIPERFRHPHTLVR